VHISGVRQRVILALLLLNNKQVVSTSLLIEAIWGDAPPRTSTEQIYICISALRKQLAGASRSIIEARTGGYLLRVDDDCLDFRQFELLAKQGATLANSGQYIEAIKALRSALELWRGPALAGIESQVLQVSRSRLNESRLNVLQDCLDIELRLGRYRQVVAELSKMVAEHPLNERLSAQLVTALHYSGRRADALAAFRSARNKIRDELGLEPGRELNTAQTAVLNDDSQASRIENPAAAVTHGALPCRPLVVAGSN
jgi:DNA-binding SARP family transcriptional activator